MDETNFGSFKTVFTESVAFGGLASRSLYTIGRLMQSYVEGGKKPYVALVLGAVPGFGAWIGFPGEMLRYPEQRDLAKFIIKDTWDRICEGVPTLSQTHYLPKESFIPM